MQVVRRRVLRCAGSRVVGIEDDLLDSEADSDLVVLGEGALLAALTRARGHTMRDIVATIQAEQDEAIRAPYQGFTMISGGPGTGKTVVALHRAAFLLYSNRRRFESGGVLVVGPSRVFMNYIERVLPSLGEDAVTLRSIGSVASDVVKLSGERVDPAPVAAIKGSLRMVGVLKRLVQEPWQEVPLELSLTMVGNVLAAERRRAVPDPGRRPRPPQAQPGPRRRREGPALGALAAGAGKPGAGSGRLRRPGPRHRRLRHVQQRLVAGGQRARRPRPVGRSGACWPGSPVPSSPSTSSACSAPATAVAPRPPTGRSPTPRCSTNWPTSWVRCPSRRSARCRCSWTPTRSEVQELVTTMERLAPGPRARPVRVGSGHLRPRAGRRGPGHHADAVADAAPTRTERQLDGRGRPGAELVAGPARVGAGDGRAGRHGPGPSVPDEHQLPQPRRGVRPRRAGRRAGLPGRRSAAGGSLHRSPTRAPRHTPPTSWRPGSWPRRAICSRPSRARSG